MRRLLTALLLLPLALLAGGVAPAVAQVCTAQPTGMFAWWRGEGNANDQTGLYNGTLIGSAGFAPGMVGPAFSFNAPGRLRERRHERRVQLQ